MTLRPGDSVKFIGCSPEQINWGNNDDPNKVLEVGKIYKVILVDIRRFHIKITLDGITGRFNSVCFDSP